MNVEALAPTSSRNEPSRRILVVDDCEDSAEIVCTLLEINGHECRAAHNGSDALVQVNAFDPEIVLLDISLPDVNGYEVAQRVRQTSNGKTIHLAALTGWARPEDRDRAFRAGFDQHVLKPLDSRKLTSVVQLASRARTGA